MEGITFTSQSASVIASDFISTFKLILNKDAGHSGEGGVFMLPPSVSWLGKNSSDI